MEDKKIVGITCDNYKLEKFKKELNENGFTDLKIIPFKKPSALTLIQVFCLETDYVAIGVICKLVEDHFKAMKN